MTHLTHVEVDETGLGAPTAELEQERRVAVFDLQEASDFTLPEAPGPYRLSLGAEDGSILFHWRAESGREGRFSLALGGLAQTAKDYRSLCESYADAVKSLPPARIEEIDAARREIHSEAGRQLQSRLSERVRMNDVTARRLFTLICAMAERC